jgi:hypothetical protein
MKVYIKVNNNLDFWLQITIKRITSSDLVLFAYSILENKTIASKSYLST